MAGLRKLHFLVLQLGNLFLLLLVLLLLIHLAAIVLGHLQRSLGALELLLPLILLVHFLGYDLDGLGWHLLGREVFWELL